MPTTTTVSLQNENLHRNLSFVEGESRKNPLTLTAHTATFLPLPSKGARMPGGWWQWGGAHQDPERDGPIREAGTPGSMT
jgi:hypothetical protein